MVVRLGLVGRGRWGRNIERTLRSFSDVKLGVIARGEPPPRELDGVLIATPSASHAEMALPYIARGIATFIEKPMATSVEDAEQLREAARRSGAPVFVGHIQLFNPAFEALLGVVPSLGGIHYLLCEGMNDRPRTDSSVLWDWLPHHLTMARAILRKDPDRVAAWPLANAPVTGAAACRFLFDGIPLVSLLSWHSPEKRQCAMIAATKGAVRFDDAEERKVAVHGADGQITYPQYDGELPLTRELKSFVQMVRERSREPSHIELGIAIVRMIAAAETSMANDGISVKI